MPLPIEPTEIRSNTPPRTLSLPSETFAASQKNAPVTIMRDTVPVESAILAPIGSLRRICVRFRAARSWGHCRRRPFIDDRRTPMRIGGALILVALGAILTFAINVNDTHGF